MSLKLSIIIPTFNRASRLEAAIERVVRERKDNYANIELIIIDGGSTDGTVDLLRRHEHNIQYWTSSPDKGYADAINKGLGLATGDVVRFLTDDDLLLLNTTADMMDYLRTHPEVDGIVGRAHLLFEDSSGCVWIRPDRAFAPKALEPKHMAIHGHQIITECMLLRTSVLQRFGNYNLDYGVAADFELCYRFAVAGATLQMIDMFILERVEHPCSSSYRRLHQHMIISARIVRRYAGVTAAARFSVRFFPWVLGWVVLKVVLPALIFQKYVVGTRKFARRDRK